jgi:hypothetical protein
MFSVSRLDCRRIGGSTKEDDKERLRMQRELHRDFGFRSFADLESAFQCVAANWNKYMYREAAFKDVDHALELASSGRRVAYQHTLSNLDEFALAFLCSKRALTLEDISIRYGITETYAGILRHNALLVVCILWVPRRHELPQKADTGLSSSVCPARREPQSRARH